MAELDRVRRWADALIALHLDPSWRFRFDNARTRAGLCDHARRTISVSRVLAARYDDDEIHQVLLHEVAHAMAGHGAGHGAAWQAIAREIGYKGGRVHRGTDTSDLAPWVGECPAGHEHVRYRRPTREVSCGRCAPVFSRAHLVTWRRRDERRAG